MTLIAETAFEGNITECCARFSQQPRPSQHAGSTHKCSGGHTKELTKCAREVYGVNTDRFGYVRERQIKSAFLTTIFRELVSAIEVGAFPAAALSGQCKPVDQNKGPLPKSDPPGLQRKAPQTSAQWRAPSVNRPLWDVS